MGIGSRDQDLSLLTHLPHGRDCIGVRLVVVVALGVGIGPSPDEERGVGGSVNDGEAGVAFRSWVVDAAPEESAAEWCIGVTRNGVAMGSPCDIDGASFKAAFSASQGVSRNSRNFAPGERCGATRQ